MSLRDTAKQWFETGDKPTQQQFSQLFDALYFLDEILDISKINGLDVLINSKASANRVAALEPIVLVGAASITIAAGTALRTIWMKDTTPISATVGTAPGLDDLYELVSANVNGSLLFDGIRIFENNTTIYFNGITSNTVIKIFKV
ncbi:MAG: hypothetical protein JSR11_03565 [Bacteroidetes bacterium]|nr:hypothetical protein [Bacteroidota bacterium]